MVNLLGARPWVDASSRLGRNVAAEFEDILDAYYRQVYALIYRMVRNEADAADLTQEAFVRVYRALPRLRHTDARAAWVRRIATNVTVDHIRRRRYLRSSVSLDSVASDEGAFGADVLQSDPSRDPAAVALEEERAQVLRRAVEALPSGYRTVIVLHHMESMRVDEIAEALRVPEGTVKSRLSRARQALRRRLSPYFDPALTTAR